MSQITLTTPLRLTILHFSQIFLTDALTFIAFPFEVPVLKFCEYFWTILGDGDSVLEMGGKSAIGCNCRPAIVQHLDVWTALIDHRLDG